MSPAAACRFATWISCPSCASSSSLRNTTSSRRRGQMLSTGGAFSDGVRATAAHTEAQSSPLARRAGKQSRSVDGTASHSLELGHGSGVCFCEPIKVLGLSMSAASPIRVLILNEAANHHFRDHIVGFGIPDTVFCQDVEDCRQPASRTR